MAYIGRNIDNLSDRAKLDAITASATATYNLLLSGAAYTPSSAESLTVSLNGVIQAPQTSYSVSGSTIIFASALTSSDTIDFILAERAIQLTTVGSGTVGSSQITADVITGQTALGAAPADTDELLISDAGTLKRVDYSYLKSANTPAFFGRKASTQGSIARATFTKVTGFTDNEIDSDTAFDGTTFTVPSGKGGKYYIFVQLYCDYGTAAGSDGEYSIASIYVNGSKVSSGLIELQGSANYIQTTCTAHTIIDLSASDTVEAYVYLKDENGGTANVAPDDSQFGGYKLIGV